MKFLEVLDKGPKWSTALGSCQLVSREMVDISLRAVDHSYYRGSLFHDSFVVCSMDLGHVA